MRSAAARASSLLARARRDHEFTRGEQLSVVMVAHIGILSGAFVISWAFDVGSGLPRPFVIGEFLIIAICGFITVRIPEFQSFLKAAGPPMQHANAVDGTGPDENTTATQVEKWAGVALIGAFIVQFAALASLLWATGGPIGSPFAEMTLAIAVFTPFLANRSETVGSVVAASIIYYAVFILLYSNNHPQPRTQIEYVKIYASTHPSVWAYFWVNVMILLGSITFWIYDSLARSWQASTGHTTGSRASDDSDIEGNGGGDMDMTVIAAEGEANSPLVTKSESDKHDGHVAPAADEQADDPSPPPET
jgi:hypothetical protein